MIISDLSFCEKIEFSNTIVGGASANTYGDAYAGPGFAIAGVTAEAFGDATYASTEASTSVLEKKNVTISKAKIKGDAWAVDANGDKDKDKIRDTDVYVLRH